MVAAQQLQPNPLSTAEDLRKHVIRLLQNNGEETRGNILVLPQVFLEFLDYDHKMALFLNHLLYWSERTKHPQRWIYKTYHEWYQELGFKESVIRRLLYGDPRAQTHKRTLTDIGVEVAVRRAPNGSPTCHYRLNLEVFLDAIRAFLDQQAARSEPMQCTVSNPCNAQDGKAAMQAPEAAQCGETLDQQITTQTSSEETSSESSDLDDDLQIFASYRKRFGKFKADLHEPFRQQITRLGRDRVGQVLERCATRGRSWSYVLRALENEADGPEQSGTENASGWDAPWLANQDTDRPAPATAGGIAIPATGRVQLPWTGFEASGKTIGDAWAAAFYQLEHQLDRASFDAWLRGTTLVDFEPETQTFVLLARTAAARDALQFQLKRTLLRLLRDVYGQPAGVQVLLVEEWAALTGQGEVA